MSLRENIPLMAKGLSLHIAVNEPDPVYYGATLKPLKACHNDANEMAELARKAGIKNSTILLDADATIGNVSQTLQKYAHDARPGDLVFVTYSGHGSQIPAAGGGGAEEDDGLDETWCLFDTQLIDTEFYQALANFKKDVRVVVLLDCCHSGTAIHEWIHESWHFIEAYLADRDHRFRHVPENLRGDLYRQHRDDYLARQEKAMLGMPASIEASALMISACQDNQRAIEDLFNGRFTSALLYETGNRHTYRSIHKQMHKHLHAFQSPNLYPLGVKTSKLLKQPFLSI